MKHSPIIQELAEKVALRGGRLLLVGGTVRDEFLGRDNKDYDCEVYGLSEANLESILETFGTPNKVGASFAVYKLGQDIDVSLPRKEKKVGVGHKGFEVTADPFMSYEEACSRRDFTINAIMKDPLTGEYIDPFNGRKDIQNTILRMVTSNTFQEDSLRVLRLAQFVSRFEFKVDAVTFDFARDTDLSDLPKERVWMEIEKLLMKSAKPYIGVDFMERVKITDKLFPHYNPVGSIVGTALNNAPEICSDLSYVEKLTVMVALLGYATDSYADGVDYPFFEELGLHSVDGYNVRKQAMAILDNLPFGDLKSMYAYHKLSQKVSMKLMGRLSSCFPSATKFANEFRDTIERLGIENEPIKPEITGKHLIYLGMKPSPELGETLDYLYDLQMRGFSTSMLWRQAKAMCIKT
jgi:tRNA nucleotidyltransferase (CCA-adding enzyme)